MSWEVSYRSKWLLRKFLYQFHKLQHVLRQPWNWFAWILLQWSWTGLELSLYQVVQLLWFICHWSCLSPPNLKEQSTCFYRHCLQHRSYCLPHSYEIAYWKQSKLAFSNEPSIGSQLIRDYSWETSKWNRHKHKTCDFSRVAVRSGTHHKLAGSFVYW